MTSLRTGSVINICEIKIIPIEEVNIFNKSTMGKTFVYASKKPYALVIKEKDKTTIIDINARELTPESLIDEVIGLKEILLD